MPENLEWFDLKPTDDVLCPECSTYTVASKWEDCEPSCEDCGSHMGLKCPECGEEYDHVWPRICAVDGDDVR